MNTYLAWIQQRYHGVTLVAIAVLYLMTLRGIAGNFHPTAGGDEAILSHFPPFETSLERGRYAQIISLVEQGSFTVDRYPEFLKPDLAWYNGHFYSAFPPGVAILSVPFYLIGRILHLSQVFAFLPTMLMSLATSYLILVLAQKLQMSWLAGMMSALFFAIASNTWAYSVTLSAHLFSAFFITLCAGICLALPRENTKKKRLLLTVLWLIYGANLFIDYPNMVILLPLLVYACLRCLTISTTKEQIFLHGVRFLFWPLVGLIPFVALFVWYNLVHFSKPIAFTNTYNLLRLDIQGIKYTPDSLSNDLFSQKAYSQRFQWQSLITGVYELLLSEDRGIFLFSPVLLLSLIGFGVAAMRKIGYWWVIVLPLLADLLLYGSFDDPYGGWAFGPRYLIPVLPLLALAAGFGFDRIKSWHRLIRFLVYLLFLVSVAISLLGALTTNGVPPAVEAQGFAAPSNYVANWLFLTSRGTSSFFFSIVFHSWMAPEWYYAFLLLAIAFLSFPLFCYRKYTADFSSSSY